MPQRETVEMARRLRREMTPPERRLWSYLKTRPGGFKFRKQHPIGTYALDFYCASAKLAIEVDGQVHGLADQAARDVRRDAWLASQGLRIVRFHARDVFADLDAVGRAILTACAAPPLHRPAGGPPPHASHGED